MIAALLFLLAAFPRVDLVDETFEIPAGDWRYVPRPLTQQPAMVDCVFESDRPDARVRLVLMSQTDLNAWRMGRDHDEVAATTFGRSGALRLPVHDLDTYIAIENRAPRPVRVRLRVFLEQPRVRYLSRGRQLAVIAISFGVFFAIVSLSARKLLKAIGR
ncbi:MAG TPA: hypothetical protein VN924_14035 [Bryobacteraceae bacterium]|jgi:hypothetical protein|nr:hypothetical protein [Bryobacteraceae bacterium]